MSYQNKKKLFVATLLLVIPVFCFPQSAWAKSLYAISNHSSSAITAYSIQGGEIQRQIETNVHWPNGAVGLALDPDSEVLFVSYDGTSKLELINARTMREISNIAAPLELAGIAFDRSKQKLYAIGRETNRLYVYVWDSDTKTLTLEDGTHKSLQNIGQEYGSYGIAVDENRGHLYVTDRTNAVKFYSTIDWSYQGTINIVVNDEERIAVGIAFHDNGEVGKYLFTGGYMHTQLNQYLTRTDVTDVNSLSFAEYNLGAAVIGVTADFDTGFVYVTTYNHHIEVYNNATFPSDPCYIETAGISGPADIIVRRSVAYKPPDFYIEKAYDINDANYVLPNDEITYIVTYGPNSADHNNVVITDYLPYEVDYENILDPNYSSNDHTYTWVIGSLDANASNNSVMLTVKVNERAAPNGVITNFCEIESDTAYVAVTVDTNVGFWQPDSDIIYVSTSSPWSPGTGMSWRSAYIDLQDALERARSGYGSEIWVAKGIYYTHTDLDPKYWPVSFELVDGVDIYGGFAGNETSRNQRNWVTNEVIFEGVIGDSTYSSTDYLIEATNLAQRTIIDGFTVRTGAKAGIKIDGGSLTIRNNKIIEGQYFPDPGYEKGYGIECINSSSVSITDCLIKDNENSGIYCDSSSFVIFNCLISGNGDNSYEGGGIYCYDSDLLVIERCIFGNNFAYYGGGILNYSSSPIVTNCVFSDNTAVSSGGGIYNFDCSSPTLVNCTFSRNSAGSSGGGMYNYESSADVTSCIFWGDYAEGGNNEIGNYSSDTTIRYCDIQGGWPGSTNINCDPCFVDANANNYHLDVNSSCIDAGDPDFNPNPPETDIDGEPRIVNGRVDMGADEYYHSPADFYDDEIVDFIDYAIFANAWQSSSGEPDYNDVFDLEDDDIIDYADLAIFCGDWLWQAAWTQPIGF